MVRQRTDIQWHIDRFREDGILLEIEKEYALDGITGVVVQNTPEFKAMLDHLKQPHISGIVLSQLDRFMRPEHVDAYGALRVFRVGKKLMYCDANNPLDITNPEDRTVIITQLEAAFLERRKIQFRTQRKKEELITDPTVSILKLPRGVEHIRDAKTYGPKTKKGHFRYTPYAYEKIAPAFERVAAGETIRSVATNLGFSTETSLRIVLNNKWWIGVNERVHQRVVTYDEETGQKIVGKRTKHPRPIQHYTNLAETPLVPVELFNRVQDIIAVHQKKWTQAQSNTNAFLGTGLLECQCGCKMYLKYDAHRGKPPVYVCSSYRTKNGPCGNSRLRAEKTDEAIWKTAVEYLTDVPFLVDAVRKAMETDEVRKRHQDLEAAKKALEALEAKKRRILKMVAMDEDEDAVVMYTKVKLEISDAKIRLATAQAQAEPFGTSDPMEIARTIMSGFDGNEHWAVQKKRQALADVVERITVDRDAKATFIVRGGMPMKCSGIPHFDSETAAQIAGAWVKSASDELPPIDIQAKSVTGPSPAVDFIQSGARNDRQEDGANLNKSS